MAMLSSDATLEAFAHCCAESQIRQFLQNLTERGRERLHTHGHIAVIRALKWNKHSHGVVRALLERTEVQVNLPGEDGNTALHTAVSMQDKIAVEMLLDRPDLDPSVVNHSSNETPLHEAAKHTSTVDILQLLLLDPRVNVAALNGHNQTALHIACKSSTHRHRVERIHEIVDSAASRVNCFFKFLERRDQFGRTALHYAAESGGPDEAVALMLNACEDNGDELARIQDDRGHLAVHIAAQHQHLGIIRRLLRSVRSFGDTKDRDGFSLLHHAVRSGNREIFLKAYRSPGEHVGLQFEERVDLYVELLGETTHYDMATFLLKHLGEGQHEYLANPVQWAVTNSHHGLLGQILKWHPEQASSAFDHALKSENEPFKRMLLEQKNVKEQFAQLHKARESYVVAANAILVVAVLVATLTYVHCLTSLEAAEQRKAIAELQQGQYGGPPLVRRFHIVDLVVLPRVAFFLSMVSTILAAFAALPFSFAFFSHQAVDDMHVKRLLYRTRVLIALASYCLIFSLWALVFNFVCSQFVAPYFDYKCALACKVAFAVFSVFSFAFVGCNGVRFCVFRSKQRNRRGREQEVDDVELACMSQSNQPLIAVLQFE